MWAEVTPARPRETTKAAIRITCPNRTQTTFNSHITDIFCHDHTARRNISAHAREALALKSASKA